MMVVPTSDSQCSSQSLSPSCWNLERSFHGRTSPKLAIVASSVSPPPHRSDSSESSEVPHTSGTHVSPQKPFDLPSWTSIDVPSDDDDEEDVIDESLLSEDSDPMPKRGTAERSPSIGSTATAAPPTSSSGSSSESVRKRKLKFNGVVITSRPPISTTSRSAKSTISATTTLGRRQSGNALTTALQQAFERNKRPISPPTILYHKNVNDNRISRSEIAFKSDASQYPLPKRRKTPDSSSVDQSPAPDDQLFEAKRPKRVNGLKELTIAYDANQVLVDVALQTQVATMTWSERKNCDDRCGRENRDTTQQEYPVDGITMQLGNAINEIKPNYLKLDTPTSGLETGAQPVLPGRLARLHAHNGYTTPRKSTAESIQERYEAFFGQLPLSNDISSSVPISVAEASLKNQDDSEFSSEIRKSPSTPESADSARAEVSTEATSECPESHPIDEKKVAEWTAALQRLVKGKTLVNEQALDNLSIVLGEIESVQSEIKDTLMTTGLNEILKQLSALKEIPYGDMHRLRERALQVSGIWSVS